MIRSRAVTLWAIGFGLTAPALAGATATPELTIQRQTLQRMGYVSTILSEDDRVTEYWLDVPGHWFFEGDSYLDLDHTIPAAAELGASGLLVVVLNGRVVERVRLSSDGTDFETRHVVLPLQGRPGPGLHLQIRYYPMGIEEGCATPDERHVTIHDSSVLHLSYRAKEAKGDLSDLPYPFAYEKATRPIPSLMVLPPEPTDEELTAASRVAAHLGRRGLGAPLSFVTRWADTPGPIPEDVNVVVVGAQARLGEALARLRLTPASGLGQGGLQVRRRADRTKAVLWVRGATPDALTAAVDALLHPAPKRGRTLAVARWRPDPEVAPEPIWRERKVDFEQLGISTFSTSGGRSATRTLYLRRPTGWVLDGSSRLNLHLTMPDPALFDSHVVVKINGRLAGVVRASESPFAELDLPAGRALNAREDGSVQPYLVVALEFTNDLVAEEEDCDPRYAEAVTVVHGDSHFVFEPDAPDLPDLAFFPFPFTRARGPAKVEISLPPPERAAHLDALWGVAAGLGNDPTHAEPDLRVHQVRDGDTPDPDRHALLVTREGAHPWLDRFESGVHRPGEVIPAAEAAGLGRPVGRASATACPWAADRQAVIVSGRSLGTMLRHRERRGVDLVVDDRGAVAVTGRGEPWYAAWIRRAKLWWKSYRMRPLEFAFGASTLVFFFLWRGAQRELRRSRRDRAAEGAGTA